MDNRKKVIIILGPTASGKTNLSIELAKRLNGEIISADSMQIYRYMDIGTAKPDENEMQGINHYMIDELEPDQNFSVSEYKRKAEEYIELIHGKGKIPIIAGGTGLYINSLIYNIDFDETTVDFAYRERLDKLAKEKGPAYIYNMLTKVDPEAAAKIHENNIKKVIRALEVYEISGKRISMLQKKSRNNESKYRYFLFGIDIGREVLYERINNRVDMMFEKGLLREVKELLKRGYLENGTSLQAIGYKEVLRYLNGEMTLMESKELIKRDTRRYAKRQITWFRKIEDIVWFDEKACNNIEKLSKIVQEGLKCTEE